MHFGTGPSLRRDGTETRRRTHKFHTVRSRRLVEDYWRSVIDSVRDPPLYHTFSDRYGGTRGIPFAARTDCSAVMAAHASPTVDSVDSYLAASHQAVEEGDLKMAHTLLSQALNHLQNSEGGMSIAALTCARKDTTAEQERSKQTATVLRRMGKIAFLLGDYEEALVFFNFSSESDPLIPDTYVLRASCYEKLNEPQKALQEFEKYMKLNEPSMAVIAHCGKCAAEAGDAERADRHLNHLLDLAGTLELKAGHEVADADEFDSPVEVAAFYCAHAYFYLGYSREMRARQSKDAVAVAKLRREARGLFDQAVLNEAYVKSFERGVDTAVEVKDYSLAVELLGHLQMMKPECADYFVRTAHLFHITGSAQCEIVALSEALDRQQTMTVRRITLLTRGTVYLEKLDSVDQAIADYTLVIGLPTDDPQDLCASIAYLKRAEALRRRRNNPNRSAANISEDEEAALRDYRNFLNAIEGMNGKSDDEVVSPVTGYLSRTFSCVRNPQCTTEAILTLASGAFNRNSYAEATRFFSRAVARGWEPQTPHPAHAAADAGEANLYDQMYIALAHTVIAEKPVSDDMFKIPYEARDIVSATVPEAKKSKAVEKKEMDKPTFALASLAYLSVDERYQALRALEPTMFSALEDAFLDLWEPYRTSVERTREEVLSARGSKRGKRHAV